jgi:hypothetical protein
MKRAADEFEKWAPLRPRSYAEVRPRSYTEVRPRSYTEVRPRSYAEVRVRGPNCITICAKSYREVRCRTRKCGICTRKCGFVQGSAGSLLRGSAASRSQVHHYLCKFVQGSTVLYKEVRFEVPISSRSVQIRTRKWVMYKEVRVRGPNCLTICAKSYREVRFCTRKYGSRSQLPSRSVQIRTRKYGFVQGSGLCTRKYGSRGSASP